MTKERLTKIEIENDFSRTTASIRTSLSTMSLMNKILDGEKRNCGTCKHFQMDGMFGVWCDINDTDYYYNDNADCLNYEKNNLKTEIYGDDMKKEIHDFDKPIESEVCASISLKRMLILLNEVENNFINNDKEDIIVVFEKLESIKQDIVLLNNTNSHILRDLFD